LYTSDLNFYWILSPIILDSLKQVNSEKFNHKIMKTTDTNRLDDIDKITEKGHSSAVNVIKFIGMLVLLALMAKLLYWLLN